MRIVTAFWLVCVTACAADRPPQPAPSSLQVDPLGEVIAIPPGSCLGLDDHFALSRKAVRALLFSMAETDTRHALELAQCNGDRSVLNVRAETADQRANVNAWWSRWSPALVTGGVGFGITIGVGTVEVIEHAH